MRAMLLAAVSFAIPISAFAQQVPAIQASATSSANVRVSQIQAAGNHQVMVPAGMPPAIHPLSPDPVLHGKDRASAAAGAAWRKKPEKPIRGPDGTVLWTFGLSLPSVVCAALEACDVALQPGEVVNNINLGDKARWHVSPAVSGAGNTRTMHIVIKPIDSGLVTSLQVYTNRRLYSIKLLSTRTQWTPKTAFLYPDDGGSDDAWDAVVTQGGVSQASAAAPAGGGANLTFMTISGDHPSWRPLHAYSDGHKTYIDFPDAIGSTNAPVLVGLSGGGGLFSSPAQQMVTYRAAGSRWVVDQVLDRAELVLGVGGDQQKVMLVRQR